MQWLNGSSQSVKQTPGWQFPWVTAGVPGAFLIVNCGKVSKRADAKIVLEGVLAHYENVVGRVNVALFIFTSIPKVRFVRLLLLEANISRVRVERRRRILDGEGTEGRNPCATG